MIGGGNAERQGHDIAAGQRVEDGERGGVGDGRVRVRASRSALVATWRRVLFNTAVSYGTSGTTLVHAVSQCSNAERHARRNGVTVPAFSDKPPVIVVAGTARPDTVTSDASMVVPWPLAVAVT